MKNSCFDLAKMTRLRRRLHLDHWQVVGLLEWLWYVTRKNHPDGAIGALSDEEISELIHCPDHIDPAELINALVDEKWLDRHHEHRLVVHDWEDHAPRYIKGGMSTRKKSGKGGFAKPLDEHVNPTIDQLQELGL